MTSDWHQARVAAKSFGGSRIFINYRLLSTEQAELVYASEKYLHGKKRVKNSITAN